MVPADCSYQNWSQSPDRTAHQQPPGVTIDIKCQNKPPCTPVTEPWHKVSGEASGVAQISVGMCPVIPMNPVSSVRPENAPRGSSWSLTTMVPAGPWPMPSCCILSILQPWITTVIGRIRSRQVSSMPPCVFGHHMRTNSGYDELLLWGRGFSPWLGQ